MLKLHTAQNPLHHIVCKVLALAYPYTKRYMTSELVHFTFSPHTDVHTDSLSLISVISSFLAFHKNWRKINQNIIKRKGERKKKKSKRRNNSNDTYVLRLLYAPNVLLMSICNALNIPMDIIYVDLIYFVSDVQAEHKQTSTTLTQIKVN